MIFSFIPKNLRDHPEIYMPPDRNFYESAHDDAVSPGVRYTVEQPIGRESMFEWDNRDIHIGSIPISLIFTKEKSLLF